MVTLLSLLAIALSGLFEQVTLIHDSVVPMKRFIQPFMQNVGLHGGLNST